MQIILMCDYLHPQCLTVSSLLLSRRDPFGDEEAASSSLPIKATGSGDGGGARIMSASLFLPHSRISPRHFKNLPLGFGHFFAFDDDAKDGSCGTEGTD